MWVYEKKLQYPIKIKNNTWHITLLKIRKQRYYFTKLE